MYSMHHFSTCALRFYACMHIYWLSKHARILEVYAYLLLVPALCVYNGHSYVCTFTSVVLTVTYRELPANPDVPAIQTVRDFPERPLVRAGRGGREVQIGLQQRARHFISY
jgi:hypothetical protein